MPPLGQGQVVRYSFPAGLFHSLLHAGLSRRSDARGCPRWAKVRWFATPFLQDSFIPYCMPVYPGARMPVDAPDGLPLMVGREPQPATRQLLEPMPGTSERGDLIHIRFQSLGTFLLTSGGYK